MAQPIEYEDRLILFLDFLGFRELIEATEADPRLIKRIAGAIDHIKYCANEQEFYASQQLTQFSDSLVVSFALDERSAVFDLILDLALSVVGLVERGFLARGAVTLGPLLHTPNYLLGPAMVRAYDWESKVAKYPRVIVDPRVLEVAVAVAPSFPAEPVFGR